MRSLLGRFHRPMSRGAMNDMLTMNSLGDGSTLSLDFTTMGSVLDPRLTFSRASTATFVNSSGYVQFANANLMRNSENCGSWSGATSITATANVAIAPNGTLTADQLNLGSGDYFYQVTATTNPVGQRFVGSVWMRTVSGTASVGLRITNTTTGSNSSITTCSVTETWQRFNTSALTLTDTANRAIDIGVDQRSIVSGPAVSANIYIWGLQLQPGASVGEYLPTTTTESYSTPRFDYSPTNIGEPRGLLIESQAVNLALRSSTMGSATYSAQEVTMSTGSSVDPSNTASAPTMAAIPGFSYSSHLIYSTVGVSNATPYTLSVFAKANGYNRIGVCIAAGARYTAVFNLTGSGSFQTSSSTASPAPTGTSYSITPYGNGWYRCSVTMTTADTTLYPHFMLVNDGAITFNVNAQATFVGESAKSIYIWGAQLELGSGASSYIPTGASGVTRNADACSLTGTNFTNVFGDGSLGTITCSHEFPRADRGVAHQPTPFGLGSYTAANARGYSYANYAVGIGGYGWVYTTASFGSATTSAVSVAKNKCAISYNGLAVTAALNGTTNSTTGTGTITVSSAVGLQIGYNTTPRDFINACVSNIKFYPTALTAAQLQTLTAP